MLTNISIGAYAFARTAIDTVVNRLKEERGQDLIEYAVFGGGLAVLIIGAITVLNVAGTNPMESIFKGISGCIDFKASTPCDPIP